MCEDRVTDEMMEDLEQVMREKERQWEEELLRRECEEEENA